MRQLWLYALAAKARQRDVLFLKENSRDPEEYKGGDDPVEYPSFFAWPEWRTFTQEFQIREVRLDFGALGHPRRKPTSLPAWGTTFSLTQCRGEVIGKSVVGSLADFKTEVIKGVLLELEQDKAKARWEEDPMVAKMTSEQCRQHVMNDHLPYSRECATCLQGSGRSHTRKCRTPMPSR